MNESGRLSIDAALLHLSDAAAILRGALLSECVEVPDIVFKQITSLQADLELLRSTEPRDICAEDGHCGCWQVQRAGMKCCNCGTPKGR